MGLCFLEELPDVPALNENYDLIIDALFGFSFAPPVRPNFQAAMASLAKGEFTNHMDIKILVKYGQKRHKKGEIEVKLFFHVSSHELIEFYSNKS